MMFGQFFHPFQNWLVALRPLRHYDDADKSDYHNWFFRAKKKISDHLKGDVFATRIIVLGFIVLIYSSYQKCMGNACLPDNMGGTDAWCSSLYAWCR